MPTCHQVETGYCPLQTKASNLGQESCLPQTQEESQQLPLKVRGVDSSRGLDISKLLST